MARGKDGNSLRPSLPAVYAAHKERQPPLYGPPELPEQDQTVPGERV